MLFKPLEIPGTSIRPRDKPGSKKCPHCKRHYRSAIIKQKGRKATYHCPHCGERVG